MYIRSNKEQSSWILVVSTDSYEAINIPWQRFIDTHKDVFPFYTHYNILVDFPFWSYSVLYKPFSYWKAHSYNVLVSKKENTIQILQGIEWGYRFLPLSLYPTMIKPRKLSSKEIDVDRLFFQSKFEYTHYKIV